MKTIEFEEAIKSVNKEFSLGSSKTNDHVLLVKWGMLELARIDKEMCGKYRINCHRHQMSKAKQKEFADAVIEYSMTKPEERKDEKKYWLLLDKGASTEPWVLGVVNAYPSSDLYDYFWAINHESYLKKKGYQTRFTDADLKKIADGDQDMLDRLTVLKREAPDNVD